MKAGDFGDAYAASQLARRDSGLRALIRRFYLRRILRYATGITVDIGCGAGQLLEQLPAGSIGLEINPILVVNLRARGLSVIEVPASASSVSLGALRRGVASTAVLSHVLEHFDDAASVLRQLMKDCVALGISRLIVVVPGLAGYRSDSTHKTFVTVDYLSSNGLLGGEGGPRVMHRSFFPGDARLLGHLFIYHELMIVYDLGSMNDESLG
jgi:hypothetical protein